MASLALNPLSRDTIILAFQLEEFLQSDHAFVSLVTDDIKHLIAGVVRVNFRPPEISKGATSLSARDARARARSVSVEAPN